MLCNTHTLFFTSLLGITRWIVQVQSEFIKQEIVPSGPGLVSWKPLTSDTAPASREYRVGCGLAAWTAALLSPAPAQGLRLGMPSAFRQSDPSQSTHHSAIACMSLFMCVSVFVCMHACIRDYANLTIFSSLVERCCMYTL